MRDCLHYLLPRKTITENLTESSSETKHEERPIRKPVNNQHIATTSCKADTVETQRQTQTESQPFMTAHECAPVHPTLHPRNKKTKTENWSKWVGNKILGNHQSPATSNRIWDKIFWWVTATKSRSSSGKLSIAAIAETRGRNPGACSSERCEVG